MSTGLNFPKGWNVYRTEISKGVQCPWLGIRSGQMSDCERFAQNTQYKWRMVSKSLRLQMTKKANMCDLLRLLMIKDRMSKSLFFEWIAHSLFCSQKKQFAHKNLTKIVLLVHLLFLLKSLTINERMWADRSGRSPRLSKWGKHSFFWANWSFAYFFWQNTVIPLENRWAISQP